MSALLPRGPEPQPLGAGDPTAERRDRRRLAVRPRIGGAGQRLRMLGDETPADERPERMAEKDDRKPRLLRGDQPVEGPEVADAFRPAVPVGEMAKVRRGRGGAVAAQVRGVGGVAGRIEGLSEPRVAPAVLGEAMGDLDDRARRAVRQPAPAEESDAVLALKDKLAPRHVVLASRSRSSRRRNARRFVDCDAIARQARAVPAPIVAPANFRLAESGAIG